MNVPERPRLEKFLLLIGHYISFIKMKHHTPNQRDRLVRDLPDLGDILRGSLLVTYPGRRIRHISLRSQQVPEVRRQLENFQRLKAGLEQICDLNQKALRTNVADMKSKSGRRNRD